MQKSDVESDIKMGGVFSYELRRKDGTVEAWESHNLVVNQGLNHALDVVLHGVAAVNPWYVAIFEGNYTPLATDTAATIVASSTECTAYTEATRPEYIEAAAATQSITNSASRATFSFNASKTIYGAFLTSVATKSATTGTLLAADKAGTAKVVTSGDQLLVTYTLTLTAT